MRWPTSYLLFDFETTGLCPEHDRIIQVGLCKVAALFERSGNLFGLSRALCEALAILPYSGREDGIPVFSFDEVVAKAKELS